MPEEKDLLSDAETLRYAVECGIINQDAVREHIEMKKREEILKSHPYKIWEGKNQKWYTYLPDSGNKHGRRLVKKISREKIEEEVYNFYKIQSALQKSERKKTTFEDAYRKWRVCQDECVCDNTIQKYETDYKRFFLNTGFAGTPIDAITEETIKAFIIKTVKEKKLCKKACKTLFGYIRNTIRSALINKEIRENPMQYMEANQFYKYCIERKRSQARTLVFGQDSIDLSNKFREDYEKEPDYIPTYAVDLASLTGMRVGELSALRWDGITDKYIMIDKSEKYNRRTKEYYIDTTKNGKERIFPVTKEIRSLLNRVKQVEIQYGYICEWVFANQDGRIHAPMISSCLKNKCRQLGIEERGIHAYRRTVNSMLRNDGVSVTVAAALLGHTEEVNEKHYTFDVSNIEDKRKAVSRVNAEMRQAQ